LPARVTRQR